MIRSSPPRREKTFDATRLHILWLLDCGPADVSALTTATGISSTAVSQQLADGHLARLVREGLNFADHKVTGEPPHE